MREQYDSHRASHPLAEYVAQRSLDGAFFDEDEGLPDGSYVGRVGRRLLVIDSQGFIDLRTYDNENEAILDFDMIHAETWEAEEL